jgi:Uncharacterized protein conserved in bacteria (DUF2188)
MKNSKGVSMKYELHVIPDKSMWVVKKDNTVHSIHIKKEAAVRVAKTLAHNLRSELLIHRRNGEILRTRPL